MKHPLRALLYGRGEPKDDNEALEEYRRAADEGNTYARDRLKNLEALPKVTIPSPKKKSPPK